MAHSIVRNWLHVVFGTKYREAQIIPTIEGKVHQILFRQLIQMGAYVEAVNGMPDHIHILFLLPPDKCLSEIIRHLKGGSSHEINRLNLLREKFAWQTGYWASSVSESKVQVVKKYIERQKEHHSARDWEAELAWLSNTRG